MLLELTEKAFVDNAAAASSSSPTAAGQAFSASAVEASPPREPASKRRWVGTLQEAGSQIPSLPPLPGLG